jgi:hypothetical protein
MMLIRAVEFAFRLKICDILRSIEGKNYQTAIMLYRFHFPKHGMNTSPKFTIAVVFLATNALPSRAKSF